MRVEQGLGFGAEQVEYHLAADFRRARAEGVSAHAVHDDEQRRALARGGRGAVLVVLTVAGQADLGAFDRQALRRRSDVRRPC